MQHIPPKPEPAQTSLHRGDREPAEAGAPAAEQHKRWNSSTSGSRACSAIADHGLRELLQDGSPGRVAGKVPGQGLVELNEIGFGHGETTAHRVGVRCGGGALPNSTRQPPDGRLLATLPDCDRDDEQDCAGRCPTG